MTSTLTSTAVSAFQFPKPIIGRTHHSKNHKKGIPLPLPLLASPSPNNNNNTPQQQQQQPTITNKNNAPSILTILSIYTLTPTIPYILLPILTDHFRITQNPIDLFIVLFTKRLFIYILALVATVYAGWRSSLVSSLAIDADSVSGNSGNSDVGDVVIGGGRGAGESLDALNREILKCEIPNYDIKSVTTIDTVTEKDDGDEDDDDDEQPIFAALDEMQNVNQNIAYALPFVLAMALSISYFLSTSTSFSLFPPDVMSDVGNLDFNVDLSFIFNTIATLSNLVLCILFTATEYRSYQVADATDAKPTDVDVINSDVDVDSEQQQQQQSILSNNNNKILSIPNIIALIVVCAACTLSLKEGWVFQNSINIAIGVTVTRALAPFLMDGATDGASTDSATDGATDSATGQNDQDVTSGSGSGSGVRVKVGSIRIIALALTGLAAYDVFSVFGTSLLSIQAAGALDDISSIASVATATATAAATTATAVATTVATATAAAATAVTEGGNLLFTTNDILSTTAAATTATVGEGVNSNIILAAETTTTTTSVMETVARSKLEGPWRPGLLEMVLVGRVSDVIGLGDIVFPACLVSWGFAGAIPSSSSSSSSSSSLSLSTAKDMKTIDTEIVNNVDDDNDTNTNDTNKTTTMAYAYATIGGYILGSILTEIVSTVGPTQGLPALIFLTPAMLGCVTLVAIQRNEMDMVWGGGRDSDDDDDDEEEEDEKGDNVKSIKE